MALSIFPSQLFFEDDVADTCDLRLENTSDHMVRYKTRLAKAVHSVFSLNPPFGRIEPGETRIVKVKFKPPSKGDSMFQLKFIEIKEDMEDNESIFEKQKDLVTTKVVGILFSGVSDDFNFASPQVSSKSVEPEPVKADMLDRARWWTKTSK